MSWKPVVFMNGDDSTRRGADMVRAIVFPTFNFIDADTGVDARLSTNDQCIEAAARLLETHRAGIKISTASDDPRIKAKGWKSANIRLRPLAKCIGMYRQTMGPGAYKRPVAVMRFGSGDFYEEQKPIAQAMEDGFDIRLITQRFNFSYLRPFAEAAVERAKRSKLQMIIASKWTISEGEKFIHDVCMEVFREAGLVFSETRGEGDFYRELSDMACAYIPINVGPGKKDAPIYKDNGGWMIVTGNANGDTFADVADLQHGGNTMGSECICLGGFSYYELPGGTAPGRRNSNFKGDSFFAPTGTLVAFCGAISGVNPKAQPYCDAVLAAASKYMENTDPADRCTQTMLEFCAREAAPMATAG